MNKFFFSALLMALVVGSIFQITSDDDPKTYTAVRPIEQVETKRKPAEENPIKPQLQEEQKAQLRQEVIKKYIQSKETVKDIKTSYKKTPVSSSSLSVREFTTKGQRLYISQNQRAISKAQYHEGMGRKIASVGNHIIYSGSKGLPVVQDPVKLIKGVATGHIIVTADKDADLTALANEHNLEVHHSVPHLNLISFIPRDQDKLLDISVALSNSSLVKTVKLDISYGGPRAK